MRKKTIEDMHALAKSKGGECLSCIYLGSFKHLTWKCSYGHIWNTAPATIVGGGWCPECGKKTIGDKLRKYSIEDMQQLAHKKNGSCLSNEYKGAHVRLKWQCSEGHIWEASPNSTRRGHWCPTCSSGLTESKCRYILEVLTNLEFAKSRKMLGDRYELDMYNPKYRVAFEYNGLQHYVYVPYFHQNGHTLNIQKQRDLEKKLRCKKNNITLVVIPYYMAQTDDDLTQFITYKLNHHDIPIVAKPDLSTFYQRLPAFVEICRIAENRGGKCLSSQYINARTKIKWECDKGHQWDAVPYSIKAGTWCPQCAPERTSKTLKNRNKLTT